MGFDIMMFTRIITHFFVLIKIFFFFCFKKKKKKKKKLLVIAKRFKGFRSRIQNAKMNKWEVVMEDEELYQCEMVLLRSWNIARQIQMQDE